MVSREHILAGHIDNLPDIPSRIVRIFISSTFSDTIEERNYLMENVYPELQKYCMAKHGLEFQVVDMRWGVVDEAQDDHKTSELCLKEIETCKRLSVGPNFVLLLGNKYGYRPFPPRIAAKEFEVLLSTLKEDGTDTTTLETWFLKDENANPPFYRLQAISTLLEHYNDNNNEKLKKSDREKWDKIFSEIQSSLRRAASICVEKKTLSSAEMDKYFISVTENETQVGILNQPEAKHHCLCFTRNIQDIVTNLKHPKAGRYIDLQPGATHRDPEAQKLLVKLRDEKIPDKLSNDNMYPAVLYWSQNGGISNQDHKFYLQDFGQKFRDGIIELVDEAMTKMTELYKDDLSTEILQHSILCQKRCSNFHGRTEIVEKIHESLFQSSKSLFAQQPLVLFGDSGCGKTSVMAKCAQSVQKWTNDGGGVKCSPVVVMRFLGTTPKSSNIRQMLYSICQQITTVYGENPEDVPKEWDQLVIYFADILRVANANKPLFIFLDSLDQLSHLNGAYRLNWLPRTTPPHCHIVISTLPSLHGVLDRAKRLFSQNRFIQVPSLEREICMDILNSWLDQEKRKLTLEQTEKVKGAFALCSLPLYTNLIFEEVRSWRSYANIDRCILESTVKGCIQNLFEKIEAQHGKILTTHSLAYLTASRNGLSDGEMNHLLSLDDHVLDEVFVFWFPPFRRIPDLLWLRLKAELQNYFIEKEADGVTVNNWYHRQFGEVARDRYLSDKKMKRYIHSNMADFFIGKWGGGKRKPFRFTEHQMHRFGIKKKDSSADRLVPEQPMEYQIDTTTRYNLRMLNELPYHLTESGRTNDLGRNVLFNYSWIYHKMKALSAQDVIMDYFIALATSPELYKETKPLVSALRVAANTLNQNPNSLPVELCGRLYSLVNMVRGRSVFSNLAILLADCSTKGLKHSALVPSHQCFEPPSPHLLFSLEGHKDLICDVMFDEDQPVLYSVSTDGSIISWDTDIGEHVSMVNLDCEVHRWTKLYRTDDGELIVCDTHREDSPLFVLNPETLEICHQLGKRKMPKVCDTAIGGHLVCRNGSAFDMDTGEEFPSLKEYLDDKEFSTVAIDAKNSTFLVGRGNNVLVIEKQGMEVVGELKGCQKPSCIVVRGDQAIVGYSVECNVKVFHSNPKGELLGEEFHDFKFDFLYRTSKPDNIYRQEASAIVLSQDKKRILVNIQGNNLVCVKITTKQMTVMNSTGIKEPCYFLADFSGDRTLIVAAESRFICLWARKSGNSLAVVPQSESLNIHKLAVSRADNRVATVTKEDHCIKIWDLDKLKVASSTQLTEPLKYENPLDESAVQVRGDYIFVKRFLPLTSERAYHLIDYFGLDIIGISSGKRRALLPYDRYGKLIDFSVSMDNMLLAVLIEQMAKHKIYVINLYDSKIVHTIPWEKAIETIEISPGKQHLILTGGEDVTIYSLAQKGPKNILKTHNEPFLTLTDSHIIAMEELNILVQALPYTVTEHLKTNFYIESIHRIPKNSKMILATEKKESTCDVHLVNYLEGTVEGKISRVSKNGIADISENGAIIIDKKLHIYSLKDLTCLGRIQTPLDNIDAKLSFDGRYAYWVDRENSLVKACNVENGKQIAQCSVHAKPGCLKLAQLGYHVIVGCKDGRLVMLHLRDLEGMDSNQLFRDILPDMAARATRWVDSLITTLDPTIRKIYETFRFYVMPKLTADIPQRIKKDAVTNSEKRVSTSHDTADATCESSSCIVL